MGTDSLVLESLEVAPTTHALTNMRSQSALKNMGQPSPSQPSSSKEDDSHGLGVVSPSFSRQSDTESLTEEVTVSHNVKTLTFSHPRHVTY